MKPRKSLRAILMIEDQLAFMEALVNFSSWRPFRSVEELRSRPKEHQMTVCLNALHMSIVTGGIQSFLYSPHTGGFFDDCQNYSKNLGANLMVEYLNKVASYFPNGIVPLDDDERWKQCEANEWRENCRGYRKEDEKYNQMACHELVERLRIYVANNVPRFENALSNPGETSAAELRENKHSN